MISLVATKHQLRVKRDLLNSFNRKLKMPNGMKYSNKGMIAVSCKKLKIEFELIIK